MTAGPMTAGPTSDPVALAPRPDGDPASGPVDIGVDVGGTKLAVLVIDHGDRVVGQRVRPMDAAPATVVVSRIVGAIDEALGEAGLPRSAIRGVGLAVPGRVDRTTGRVRHAVNLDWIDEPVGDLLRAALGVPVAVENDVRAAVVGLHRRGLPLATDDMAYLNVGTGISVGAILGGRLHRGVNGMAGELGHLAVSRDRDVCRCGLPGCIEAIAAGPAIVERASVQGRTWPDAGSVFTAAAAGDPVAAGVVQRVGRVLALVVHGLVAAYDVNRVVIGGGVTRAGAAFLGPIEVELDRRRAASSLAAEMLPPDLVRLVPEDIDAGALGVLAILRDELQAVIGRPTGEVSPA